MIRGGMENGPGFFRVGTVFVLWPLLYIYFIGISRDWKGDFQFLKVIILASMVAALLGIWLVAEALGLSVPGGNSLLRSMGAAVGVYDGYIEYALYNMSTLIYAFPFLVMITVLPRSSQKIDGLWIGLTWIALILTCVAMILSGRRMFWLIAMLTPIIVCGLLVISRISMRRAVRYLTVVSITLVIVLIFAASMFSIEMENVGHVFLSAFDVFGKGEESAGVRHDQFIDLIDGWGRHPILGAGHGVPAPHVIRSADQPWAYELSYVALLYQAGLLGVLTYGLAVGWTFFKGIEIVRRDPQTAGLLLPLLAGMTGFLISNATNPYLAKFDYLWTIFLPVAVINAYLVGRRLLTSSSSIGTPVVNSARACSR